MSVRIVVGGESDLAILKTLLPNEIQTASKFVLSGERSNITSVARTLLVKYKEPVAVVVHTYSLDPAAIREKYLTTEDLLRDVSGGTPFKVVLCVPELRTIFFNLPEMLERIFPRGHLDSHLMFYKTQPKEALEFFFTQGGGPTTLPQLLETLTEEDAERLRATGPIRELITFVGEVAAPAGKQP